MQGDFPMPPEGYVGVDLTSDDIIHLPTVMQAWIRSSNRCTRANTLKGTTLGKLCLPRSFGDGFVIFPASHDSIWTLARAIEEGALLANSNEGS